MINLNNEMAQIVPVLEKITKNSNETYENAWDMICDWEGRKDYRAFVKDKARSLDAASFFEKIEALEQMADFRFSASDCYGNSAEERIESFTEYFYAILLNSVLEKSKIFDEGKASEKSALAECKKSIDKKIKNR